MNELVLSVASLMLGMAEAARKQLPRRFGLAQELIPQSDPPRLENAYVALSLADRQSHDEGGEDLHVVVENCGRAAARNVDVALLPIEEVDGDHPSAEPRPKHRIRFEALDQGERRVVPVTTLPGPIVAATCRWSDGFADYERQRLLKVV